MRMSSVQYQRGKNNSIVQNIFAVFVITLTKIDLSFIFTIIEIKCRSHGLPALSRVWLCQHVKLPDVRLGTRPRYSLVVDEDIKKPTNQTNKRGIAVTTTPKIRRQKNRKNNNNNIGDKRIKKKTNSTGNNNSAIYQPTAISGQSI